MLYPLGAQVLTNLWRDRCRRIVPGQYLAADPKGRAVMLGALEKQKMVYVFNRDAQSNLTISSPLEAHKTNTLNLSMVGVDVGFENPIFAVIELDYTDADQDPTGEAIAEAPKMLTFYELDLGLNHVVRKWSEPIDPASNMLVGVPGDTDGPSGVLVCAENKIAYKKPDHEDVVSLIPRREGMPLEQPLMLTSYAMLKQKDSFFFLMQSELGDVYRVTLEWKDDDVSDINISYFDTLPVAQSMVILKTGFLFLASEFGNHGLYQFLSIKGGEEEGLSVEVEIDGETIEIPHFRPRTLKNLLLVDDIESLSPVLDAKVLEMAGEETPQIYALCGRGGRSTLRTLRHGLAVSEMAVSELPSNPSAVWTVRADDKAEHDKYIVVSFPNATIVLSIGETVEEVQDSGFLATTSTISVSLLGEDSLLQIHPQGMRRVRPDRRVQEFSTPNKGIISKAAVNGRQVAIALTDNSIIYWELDETNSLAEKAKPDPMGEVAAMDIMALSAGRTRSRFLAVGSLDPQGGTWVVRVLSLEPGDFMQVLSRQALPDKPESLCLCEISTGASVSDGGTASLFLFAGLASGVLMRLSVDPMTGQLAPDYRSRFLGAKPVKLFKVNVQGQPAVLALSSRSWLAYNYQGRYQITPLSYETLEWASSFASEDCKEGFVSVAANTLRILTVERYGETFNQQVQKLTYTPRRSALLKNANCLVVIETDHNTAPVADLMEGDKMEEDEDQAAAMPRGIFGIDRAGAGRWASCIRVVDPNENKTVQAIELAQDEAALSVVACSFHERKGETFVLVGTVTKAALNQRSAPGHIHTYLVQGNKLVLQHKTEVEGAPRALAAFQGRLLVGLALPTSTSLRMYDLGKKKLLRKCENKSFPNMIVSITTQADRIFVGDVAESVLYVKYNKTLNSFAIFADDTHPRWITTVATLDYDTIAAADKFGNIFVSRLPANVSDDANEAAGEDGILDGGHLGGAGYKVEEIVQYHVGETVCSLQRATLTPGGAESIVYSTLYGGIGALQPFVSREDVDFFTHLEMHLRGAAGAREVPKKGKEADTRFDHPSICGRDQLGFRSYYYPVKNTIDGDLCETFIALDPGRQKEIAQELDRTPGGVCARLLRRATAYAVF